MSKFYVGSNGAYLGEFTGSVPTGGIEIDGPPPHGQMVYINNEWDYPLAVKSDNERAWRDGELKRSDIEIFTTEDTLGVFDAAPWRTYRLALRAWPESPDFPDSTKRPVAPDAV